MPSKSSKTLTAVLVLPALVLTGCPRDREEALTLGEATAALEQASDAGQAEGLTAASVDLSTSFTIGQAVNDGALELRTFIGSQLPCADISLEDATLTVVYGAKPGNCRYRAHAFEGTHVIAIERNDDAEVHVHHEWIGFTNGVVSLDGTADATWSFTEATRRVKHTSQWRHVQSGRVGQGSGDRVQSLLAGGLAEGIQVDGERTWEGERGRWDLGIDGVQMRWTEPVPQAGRYTLSAPFDKSLAMSFRRVDDDTISVTVSGPRRDFSFDVSKLGVIAERE
ncbi:MAG: hypothetical protein K0R38_2965 [Polyangiaceae bacterium]|jgi:hypothetical protein|nr:hypothetical protein [Polyangiaceae bacterium]